MSKSGREQPLLEVNENKLSPALLRFHQRGVLGQLFGELELHGGGIVEAFFFAILAEAAGPSPFAVLEVDLDDAPLRELVRSQLPEVFLEAPHHDGLELLGAGHGYAAGEPLGVQNFKQ